MFASAQLSKAVTESVSAAMYVFCGDSRCKGTCSLLTSLRCIIRKKFDGESTSRLLADADVQEDSGPVGGSGHNGSC